MPPLFLLCCHMLQQRELCLMLSPFVGAGGAGGSGSPLASGGSGGSAGAGLIHAKYFYNASSCNITKQKWGAQAPFLNQLASIAAVVVVATGVYQVPKDMSIDTEILEHSS